MKKIIKSFGLYWHCILDIILTHVYVIAFLRADHAVLAAFFMSLDSVLRVSLSIVFSRMVMSLQSFVRYRISTVLRLILIVIWFIAVLQLPFNALSILFFMPYLIFKISILIDSLLTADLIFAAHEEYKIDLSKSAAAQNILARASTAFAPAVALILLSSIHAKFVGLFFAIVIGLSFTILLRRILFEDKNQTALGKTNDALSFKAMLSNPMMRWGFAFQVLGNFSFGGVAFLLLAMLKLHTNVFFNEISALYAAFLITQTVILIFGERIVPLYNTTHVSFTMALCGLFVLATSLVDFSLLQLCLCAGIGLFYSLTLSGIQKVVVAALRGPTFISYSSYAQTASRLTAFIIITLLGFAMHSGFAVSNLLTMLGILGIFSSLVLASL